MNKVTVPSALVLARKITNEVDCQKDTNGNITPTNRTCDRTDLLFVLGFVPAFTYFLLYVAGDSLKGKISGAALATVVTGLTMYLQGWRAPKPFIWTFLAARTLWRVREIVYKPAILLHMRIEHLRKGLRGIMEGNEQTLAFAISTHQRAEIGATLAIEQLIELTTQDSERDESTANARVALEKTREKVRTGLAEVESRKRLLVVCEVRAMANLELLQTQLNIAEVNGNKDWQQLNTSYQALIDELNREITELLTIEHIEANPAEPLALTHESTAARKKVVPIRK